MLFIAGQLDYDDKGDCAHPGDFKAQVHAVLTALKAQVEAAGGTMQSIVKVNTYVTDMRFRADDASIPEKFFGRELPAHTTVAVIALGLPEFLVEVEAIAML
jgi:2-iminobutanoate/2-iminopropanoate deaminase